MANRARAIPWSDALIVAAAVTANCQVIYAEDLGHGQIYAGMRIEDPLRARAA